MAVTGHGHQGLRRQTACRHRCPRLAQGSTGAAQGEATQRAPATERPWPLRGGRLSRCLTSASGSPSRCCAAAAAPRSVARLLCWRSGMACLRLCSADAMSALAFSSAALKPSNLHCAHHYQRHESASHCNNCEAANARDHTYHSVSAASRTRKHTLSPSWAPQASASPAAPLPERRAPRRLRIRAAACDRATAAYCIAT